MRASAALLGSLRSPRRAAEPQSGHFTCYKNRTLYLLPTTGGCGLATGKRPEIGLRGLFLQILCKPDRISS